MMQYFVIKLKLKIIINILLVFFFFFFTLDRLLNHIMKQGSATGNTLGALTVMYSGFGVLLQFLRGEDDEANTMLAGTATGLLYKSTAGLKRCAIGGAVGLSISALYSLYILYGSSDDRRNKMIYG